MGAFISEYLVLHIIILFLPSCSQPSFFFSSSSLLLLFTSDYFSFLPTGKIQTIYDWDTCTVPATEPPAVWFHDILNADGTAFNATEVSYIQSITGAAKN